MKTSEIIEALKEKGYSKYRIAKTLQTTWATVNLWHRNVFQPNKEHKEELEKLLRR